MYSCQHKSSFPRTDVGKSEQGGWRLLLSRRPADAEHFHFSSMAPVKVAVNGIGRIGHLAVRLVFERPDKFELVHLNDIGSCDSIAYLIKRDSVHGPWKHGSKADGGDAVVFTDADSGRTLRVPYSMAKTPAALADAYKKAGVELLLECTGEFLKHATLEPYFSQCGVKKIVVSAPVKDTPEVCSPPIKPIASARQPRSGQQRGFGSQSIELVCRC